MMPIITLIGYRCTGKSTVAALLSEAMNCPWLDADSVLEERLGCSIASVVRSRGEAFFREEESAVLETVLASFSGVLATGGGVVLQPRNRDLLRTRGGAVVWLVASADAVRSRLAADPMTSVRRPALIGADPLVEVDASLAIRDPLYRECAEFTIDTAEKSAEDVARKVAIWFHSRPPEPGLQRPSP